VVHAPRDESQTGKRPAVHPEFLHEDLQPASGGRVPRSSQGAKGGETITGTLISAERAALPSR
jgi:hypothetical protein